MYEYIDLEQLRIDAAASGYTQQIIAERAGLHQSNVSRFLNGERSLSFFSYVNLVKAIDEDPKKYLTEKGKKVFTLELE